MREVVIVAARRTAVGAFQGALSSVPAVELGAAVIRQLLADSGLPAEQVDEVLLGQVLELRARERTGGAIRALLDLAPRIQVWRIPEYSILLSRIEEFLACLRAPT